MYRFENEAYNTKLKECIAEYEVYRKMMLEPVDFSNPQSLIQRLQTRMFVELVAQVAK